MLTNVPNQKTTLEVNLLTVDKIPFVLAFLLGLLGYQLNTIAEATVNSPAIEYDFEVLEERDSIGMVQRYTECTITNITSSKSFENLTINMMFDEDSPSQIYSPGIIPVTPSSLHNITFEELNGIVVEYNIERLQPSFLYRLTFKTLTQRNTDFPKLFLATNTSVRLIKASIGTWLIKNYLMVNFILILTLVVLVVIYLVYVKFFNPNIKKDENTRHDRSIKPRLRYLSSSKLYNTRSRKR